MHPTRSPLPWLDTVRATPGLDLLSPATQIVADRDAYLGQGRGEVGRRIDEDHVELFINGDVAGGLRREFENQGSEFIVLHDVGCSGSLRLLEKLAERVGSRVQRLSIRRQGQGMALAVMQVVEVSLIDGSLTRVYSTDVNNDAQVRQQLARVTLAWSKLGVVMVGEVPAHTLSAALQPLQEALERGAWHNRDLLLLPMGSGTPLATLAAGLGGDGTVAVHVSPRAARPQQAWGFIAGGWDQLQGPQGGQRSMATRFVPEAELPASRAAAGANAPATGPKAPDRPQPASAALSPATPVPVPVPMPMPMPAPGSANWQAYITRCAAIHGVIGCCVFDTHTVALLAHGGHGPSAQRLAQQGALLLADMQDTARALGLGQGQAATRPEAVINTGAYHLMLRHVAGHPGIALHLVLQAPQASVTLVRMQLDRIEPPQ